MAHCVPGQHRGSGQHPRDSDVVGWHGVYEADALQASQVLLRHNQVGQALERDQKPIAFQGRIALSHPGIAGIGQNATFVDGYEFIDSETLCILAIDKPNK